MCACARARNIDEVMKRITVNTNMSTMFVQLNEPIRLQPGSSSTHTHTHTHTHTYTHTHTHTHTFVALRVFKTECYTHMYTCLYTHNANVIPLCIHTYTLHNHTYTWDMRAPNVYSESVIRYREGQCQLYPMCTHTSHTYTHIHTYTHTCITHIHTHRVMNKHVSVAMVTFCAWLHQGHGVCWLPR